MDWFSLLGIFSQRSDIDVSSLQMMLGVIHNNHTNVTSGSHQSLSGADIFNSFQHWYQSMMTLHQHVAGHHAIYTCKAIRIIAVTGVVSLGEWGQARSIRIEEKVLYSKFSIPSSWEQKQMHRNTNRNWIKPTNFCPTCAQPSLATRIQIRRLETEGLKHARGGWLEVCAAGWAWKWWWVTAAVAIG